MAGIAPDLPVAPPRADLRTGDCRDILKTLPDASVDAVVTDPPYDLTSNKKGGTGHATLNLNHPGWRSRIGTGGGFMGQTWDATGIAFDPELWREVLRVLKPGAHLLAFGGTRTVHRMACAIEDAGFEIRDRLRYECAPETRYGALWDSLNDAQRGALLELMNEIDPMGSELAWQFGSGFPKSRDFSRDMPPDLQARWAGWGSALKPAYEPIIVARKPLLGTIAENVARYGVGGMNIDGCRVASASQESLKHRAAQTDSIGRWPANVLHDDSDDLLAHYPHAPGQLADAKFDAAERQTQNVYGAMRRCRAGEPSAHSENRGAVGFAMRPGMRREDPGSAARFFYAAKASRKDRHEGLADPGPQFKSGATLRQIENADTRGNVHPTVKPTELMRWLVRLVCPPGGVVLDPFMGSGSTGKACMLEGLDFVGIEMMPEYLDIAKARIAHARDVLAQQDLQADAPHRQPDLFEGEVAA